MEDYAGDMKQEISSWARGRMATAVHADLKDKKKHANMALVGHVWGKKTIVGPCLALNQACSLSGLQSCKKKALVLGQVGPKLGPIKCMGLEPNKVIKKT